MTPTQLLTKSSHRQFSSLMELYESNYILLRRMLPDDIASLPEYSTSHATGHLDLHIWVLERAKFTTTLRISYQFIESLSRSQYEPDLTVRIYHDARVAETMSAIVHGKPRLMRHASTIKWRWGLNRFLFRWLRYCMHQGHSFRT